MDPVSDPVCVPLDAVIPVPVVYVPEPEADTLPEPVAALLVSVGDEPDEVTDPVSDPVAVPLDAVTPVPVA